MFSDFFYKLKANEIPVTPTSFLRLHKALRLGLILSVDDFYTVARAILIKSERYFDVYDQIFASHFKGDVLQEPSEEELTDLLRAMLEEWLRSPADVAAVLGVEEQRLENLSIGDLIKYFLETLNERHNLHRGGENWIGIDGTSPMGNMGNRSDKMQLGVLPGSRSALKIAQSRRYKEYSQDGPLKVYQIGEALKRLRNMIPTGPRDLINIDRTIYETVRNAGQIEIIFDRRLLDRLKIVLLIDNGGSSMDPYVDLIQVLFSYAHAQFKDLKIYYFHNTIRDKVWTDPQRATIPEPIIEFIRKDPETRIIIVGDASMAPYELAYPEESLYGRYSAALPSIEHIRFLAKTFHHIAWLNPLPIPYWSGNWSLENIREIFPMFELTLDGLEKAVRHLVARRQ